MPQFTPVHLGERGVDIPSRPVARNVQAGGQRMRVEYDAELEAVSQVLVAMADAVRVAMRQATTALLTADAELAQQVISSDPVVNEHHRQDEGRVYGLLARQAPVAYDLPMMFSALHIA